MMNADAWNKRYQEKESLWVAAPDRGLVELAERLTPGVALDLGAGEGRNSLYLASHGWKVTAVEFSSVAIERLQRLATQQGVNLDTVQSDIFTYLRTTLPAVDLVVVAYLHFPPEDRNELYRLLSDAVMPGTHLCLIGHHVESFGHVGPPDPARLWSESDFATSFQDFDTLLLEKRIEGTDHGHGDAPVLIAWLRKKVPTTTQ